VGHPRDAAGEAQTHVVGYVLGDFSGDEAEVIKKVIAEVDQVIMTLITDGLETTMNRFNKTNSPKPEKPEVIKKAAKDAGPADLLL
jgi:peptidyl-tRNA hydrolase